MSKPSRTKRTKNDLSFGPTPAQQRAIDACRRAGAEIQWHANSDGHASFRATWYGETLSQIPASPRKD